MYISFVSKTLKTTRKQDASKNNPDKQPGQQPMHYQFFCSIGAKNLPSIVITAKNFRQAEKLATSIYDNTIDHFNLQGWTTDISGYYVGRNVFKTEQSARLASN